VGNAQLTSEKVGARLLLLYFSGVYVSYGHTQCEIAFVTLTTACNSKSKNDFCRDFVDIVYMSSCDLLSLLLLNLLFRWLVWKV